MRRYVVVLGLIALMAACGSDDSSVDVFDQSDAGETISVQVGDRFEIRLESNATTGYAWQVVDQPAVVDLVSSDYEAPDTDLVGAGGVEVFVFAGASPGAAELNFEYVRSFEDPPEPADTSSFPVEVTE